jgi:hypothetical protein
MPKELSHWILAERTWTLLKDGPVREAINAHPHFYYLGAIIYDSPFYALGIGDAQEFARVAGKLHGVTGDDTFEPFRRMIDRYGEDVSAEAMSFIAGTYTHYWGDVIFHPVVNYYSGKYDAKHPAKRREAQKRHRAFEAFMDIFFSGVYARETGHPGPPALGAHLRNDGRLSNTLTELEGQQRLVEELVRSFYKPEIEDLPIWPLLKRHAGIQKQFFRRIVSVPIRTAGLLLGGGMRVVGETFYPTAIRRGALKDPEKTLPLFSTVLAITHPNTGEILKGTIEDFAARMTMEAADFIGEFQQHLERGDQRRFLRGQRGSSLEYGCDPSIYPEPVHFDQSQPIKKLCRQGPG